MLSRFNDKPVTMFSCLSVCEGHDGILSDRGTVVTFHAYMAGDKSRYVYTFNAFDEMRERVISMKLEKKSRIMVVAAMKNYIGNDNMSHQSFTICMIDYCPADNRPMIMPDTGAANQALPKQVNSSVPEPQNNTGTGLQSKKSEPPIQTLIFPENSPYSLNQAEVDLEEFANAIGG